MLRGSLGFQVGYRAWGLTEAKSSLPAIRKMTVLMVSKLVKPRARRFEEAVGLAGLRPGDDAFEVAAYHGCDLLHGLDPGAHDAGAPVLEHVAHHVDPLALEDLAQLLLVDPRPRGTHGGHPGDQGVQIGGVLGPEAGAILQQRPAHALEGLVAALLDAPHLVHRRVGVPDESCLEKSLEREKVTGLTAVLPLSIQVSALEGPTAIGGPLRCFVNNGGPTQHQPRGQTAAPHSTQPRCWPGARITCPAAWFHTASRPWPVRCRAAPTARSTARRCPPVGRRGTSDERRVRALHPPTPSRKLPT